MQNNYKKHYVGLAVNQGIEFFNAFFQPRKKSLSKALDIAYKNEGLGNGYRAYAQVDKPLQLVEGAYPHVDLSEGPNFLKLVHIRSDAGVHLKTLVWKRLFDILFSLILMMLGFPVFAAIYIITKISSPGPVFYKQERVGKNELKFHIYKFRSMYVDAEKYGPQLSNENDPRITRWGRVIRRTRLDELPQFWNVLKGDMSVVGPRPERRHFIDKIVEINPAYKKLHLVRPGITSMGQVHYGYAENVDQMCIRMEYDLQYLQKVNIRADLKVILRTVRVMVQCKGK